MEMRIELSPTFYVLWCRAVVLSRPPHNVLLKPSVCLGPASIGVTYRASVERLLGVGSGLLRTEGYDSLASLHLTVDFPRHETSPSPS